MSITVQSWWLLAKQWLAETARKRRVAKFNRGYNYAMDEVRSGLHPQPMLFLHSMVEESMCFGEYDEFDKGVEKALNELDPAMDYLNQDI